MTKGSDASVIRLEAGDDEKVVRAQGLFDGSAKPEAVARFLSDERHHLLIAYEADEPAGFVSGVEMTHPDKGTAMFLYELSVDSNHRRRGIGKALVQALSDLARERGCYEMWVLTDPTNAAGIATYEAAGGQREADLQLMLSWSYDADRKPS